MEREKKTKNAKKTKEEKITGIKDISHGDKKINIRLSTLRNRLLSTFPFPKFTYDEKQFVIPGNTISVGVDGLPLPEVDLFNGKLIKPRSTAGEYPINACFYKNEKPIVTPARYDEKKKRLLIKVPKDAESGIFALLFPVKERYGPLEMVKKVDKDFVLKRQFGDICSCKKKKQKSGGDQSCETYYQIEDEIEITKYYDLFIGTINVLCRPCRVCCPNGAIKFDTLGRCYVDPEICEGQKYQRTGGFYTTEDGRNMMERGPEQICWECFEGDEVYSRKCPYRKLQRVLHHNTICCANCKDHNRVVGLRLDELCPYDAIYIDFVAEDDTSFFVDKNKCKGCFACYYGINCYNNYSFEELGGENYTLRMVSYIGTPKWEFHLIIYKVKFDPFHFIDPDNYVLPRKLFAMRIKTESSDTTIPFTLDDNWTYTFKRDIVIDFQERLHFILLSRTSGGGMLPVGCGETGVSLPVRTIRSIKEEEISRLRFGPQSIRIKTAIGYFTFDCELRGDYISSYVE